MSPSDRGSRVIQNRAFAHDPTMRHRTVETTLTVRTPDGQPVRDATVVVEQRSHEFLSGCIGFDFVGLADGEAGPFPVEETEALAQLWLDVFNAATLPFYWGAFEPVPGQPNTRRLLHAARWFADRGCVIKGHPLAWHTVTAPWLLDQ